MATQVLTNGGNTAPNESLYCSNLPDKLQKDDLKRALYMLFVTYGPVLDITALKTSKMRGQAHVLFRSRDDSARAMRALQGFEFFGKSMSIQYARSKSDTLAKLDGTYKQPQTRTDVQASATQQSIFAGPPGTTSTGGASSVPQANGLGPPPDLRTLQLTTNPASPATSASQGAKRAREESEEEDDAAMDESDDD